MRIRLKYVRHWVDRKTGRCYARLRRPGLPEISLPGVIGSPEFMAGYHAALRGEQPAPVVAIARSGKGTVSAAVAEYVTTALVKRVPKESSRKRQEATLRQFCALENVGTSPLPLLNRKYMDRLLGDAPTLNVAYTWLITVREFTRWAVTRGLVEADPCAGIVITRPESDGHDFFSEEQIAQFEARWPIGTRERLLFSLLLYTGQRCSDVRQLGRHSIIDNMFPVKQIKTGVQVYVPVHPALAEAIAACNVVGIHSDTFLATKDGK